MNRFVLDLFFCCTHKISDSSFSILSPVGLNISNLVGKYFSIESSQERHDKVLLSFKPEVVVCKVESPSISSCLSKHEEIFSTCNKPESDKSTHENECMSSCHTEVFIMWTDLFGAFSLCFCSHCVGYSQKYWFEWLMKRMNISSLCRSFEFLSRLCSLADFFLEGFYISSVSLRENAKGSLGYLS